MEAQLSGGVRHSWLKHFHITFFGMVFGMTGFTLAVQMASTIFSPLLLPAGHLIRYATVILMITIVSIYLLKLVRFPEAVSSEWIHPNKINFFPLFGMSLLVLGSSFFKSHPKVSLILWVSGTVLQFLSSVIVVSIWAGQTHFRIEHMTPGWFIPIVGSIIVPIAGVKHGFIELSWFFFTVGLFFWLALFTIVMYRIVFHPPIPERLLPTLFIMIAPPALGFISYINFTGGELDAFARILYYVSLFIFLMLIFWLPVLAKIKFSLSWWATSFPVAAKVQASIIYFGLSNDQFFKVLALFEFGFLVLVIFVLIFRTIVAALNKEICVEE
ncbi:MAG: C4-dicarboxylate ABC transporter [Chlorobiaceae bacterium]|nr:C4-dicarboxylate ABC transporter [Chlorobiaceae bacterium]